MRHFLISRIAILLRRICWIDDSRFFSLFIADEVGIIIA